MTDLHFSGVQTARERLGIYSAVQDAEAGAFDQCGRSARMRNAAAPTATTLAAHSPASQDSLLTIAQ
jgi:hypothetical protein